MAETEMAAAVGLTAMRIRRDKERLDRHIPEGR